MINSVNEYDKILKYTKYNTQWAILNIWSRINIWKLKKEGKWWNWF